MNNRFFNFFKKENFKIEFFIMIMYYRNSRMWNTGCGYSFFCSINSIFPKKKKKIFDNLESLRRNLAGTFIRISC